MSLIDTLPQDNLALLEICKFTFDLVGSLRLYFQVVFKLLESRWF